MQRVDTHTPFAPLIALAHSPAHLRTGIARRRGRSGEARCAQRIAHAPPRDRRSAVCAARAASRRASLAPTSRASGRRSRAGGGAAAAACAQPQCELRHHHARSESARRASCSWLSERRHYSVHRISPSPARIGAAPRARALFASGCCRPRGFTALPCPQPRPPHWILWRGPRDPAALAAGEGGAPRTARRRLGGRGAARRRRR